MISMRKNNERGKTQLNWLTSFHTFSFAEYYEPEFMGFNHLRVINEDTVQPGCGFATHPHKNMEIITYVVEGALEHKDSMGTGSVIKPGEIQCMSAGTGITHSEFNHSMTDLLHLLQIWIIPDRANLTPGYEQKTILKENNKLILIGSKNGGNGTITIHQNVALYVAYLTSHHVLNYQLKKQESVWIQLIKGKINLNNQALSSGDGATITDEKEIKIECSEDAEFLLFSFN